MKIAVGGEADDAALAERAEPPAAAAAGADRAELDHRLPCPPHQLAAARFNAPRTWSTGPGGGSSRCSIRGEGTSPVSGRILRRMHAPTVETTSGKLIGATHRGTAVFRGIPFAAPPVGALRFRPPQPVAPWSGVREALAFGPMAPQLPSALEALAGNTPLGQSEDCLTLNVWTPACDGREAAGDGLDPRRWLHDRHRGEPLVQRHEPSRCRAMSSS